MKHKLCKLFILVFMLSLLAGSAYAVDPPAMEWHKVYNGSEEESHPHYVIETSDGGFLMVGETGFIPNSAKIYVVKTDSSGNLIWQKEFGSSGYNLGNGCVETPDGNYVIAGTLNYDAALIKVDASTGNALSGWPKTWNIGTEDSFEAVENTPDGGLIATGYRDGLAENTFLNWGKGNLIKTDADGNQSWNKDISAYMCSGYRIKRISDGYMVSGHPAEEGQPDYTLMKFDFDGNVVWAKTPHPDIYWGFDVGANGNMILAGHSSSPLSNNLDLVTVEVDSAGNPLWTEYAGQPRGYNGDYIHDEAWGARATPDGGYVVVAGSGDEYTYSECGHPLGCSDRWIVYLLKYSSNGTLEWEGLYADLDVWGSQGDNAGEDVCVTSDGGYLVANDVGGFAFTKIASDGGGSDTDPPTPNPMTWSIVPYAVSDSSIAMEATTASDASGVEYYFDETTGNTGGADSGWQDSTSYTDTGLSSGTQYTYTVTARDKSTNQNATTASTAESATTTAPDTDPPTPDPMTWASVPSADSGTAISMTATTASDASGVEYYFDETSGNSGGTDSGWQDSVSYTDTGLQASTQYTYTVKARDKSAAQNQTGTSTAQSATTQAGGGSWTKVDDRDGSASYSGGWNQTSPSTAYMNTAMFTGSSGETVTYSFTGTQVRFYVWQYDTGQGLDVSIDDVFQETVNISSGSEASILAWESGTLSNAGHTLKLTVVSGEPHVDAFEYYSGGGADTTPPTPDPMTWSSVPSVDSDTAISMTASTATDASGVEYYFDETTGNTGGTDSGWQDSQNYTDTGLSAGTQYTYTVTARDKSTNQNETAASTAESATTTSPDTDPPTPDPMTWQTLPSPDSGVAISMEATTATDASGVEYYFNNVTDPTHDSGWQGNTAYTDSGLTPGTEYTYQIKARDLSTAQNETAYSSAESATTLSPAPLQSENGKVTGVGSSWQTVTLTNTYDSMVVVAAANYDNTSDPAVVRIQNASGTSFDVRVDAAGGATPSGIDVCYLVVEEGVYTTAQDGVTMEAVKYLSTVTDENNNWTGETQSYSNTYTSPVVLGQVMSYSDSSFSTFWCYGDARANPPDASNLNTGKSVAEDTDTTRNNETVGYIVIESGSGSINGDNYVAGLGTDTVKGVTNSPPYSYSISGLTDASVGIATLAAMDGGNGGWAVLYGANPVTASAINIAIDEDIVGDTERSHTTEQVGYIVFESETAPDTDPPTPNPATFASVPAADSDTAISMTATTGSDASGPVEYNFDETSGNPGGTDSGWQSSTSYTDTGLSPDTQYTYTVQMRDSVPNTGTASSSASATTQSAPDTNPPTPNPATFSSVPSADSDTAISMTATTGSDPSAPIEYYFDETSGNPGGSDSGWQTSASYTDTGLSASTQYTYTVQMRDTVPNTGTASAPASATTDNPPPDTDPPTPNPATFASAPSADSDTAISMTATTGSDLSGPVEYYFDETSGNAGGSDSGWQTSASYTDTGLSASTQYTYTVQMRDSVPNTGTASGPASATTQPAPDTDPPTPNPATFASVPSADSDTAISMTATTGSDPSGVEYYFEETSGSSGGSDSGWQTSASYTDSGLSASTQYTYRVQMRDQSTNQNTGSWSSTESATTQSKSDCGAAPMYRDGTLANVSAGSSSAYALLPLIPSLLSLGIWSIRRRRRKRR